MRRRQGAAHQIDVELLSLGQLDLNRQIVETVVLERGVLVGDRQCARFAGLQHRMVGGESEQFQLLDDTHQPV